jgi:hypothetical protein
LDAAHTFNKGYDVLLKAIPDLGFSVDVPPYPYRCWIKMFTASRRRHDWVLLGRRH